MDSELEENIKNSFKKAKDHAESLENELRANRNFIIKQNKQIDTLISKISVLNERILQLEEARPQYYDKKELEKEPKYSEFSKKKDKISYFNKDLPLKNEFSKGNKGGSLDGYSLIGYSLPGYSLDIQKFREEIPYILTIISRQEFITFLTIYQQEEEFGKVTYSSVAKELNISPGCIRTYVSGLIKKGLPVIKAKYNNKLVVLSIPSEIRGLNIKKKLIQTFYNLDPNQKKLDDSY